MASTTNYIGLNVPDKGTYDWDVPVNANWEKIDDQFGLLGYSRGKDITAGDVTTVTVQPDDEIIHISISNTTIITFDFSNITLSKGEKECFTCEVELIFPNGAKTVSLLTSFTDGIKWINNFVPDVSSGKNHWIGFRCQQGQTWLTASDNGEVG